MPNLKSNLITTLTTAIILTQCTPSSNQLSNNLDQIPNNHTNIRKIITYDTPGRCSEIIAYSKNTKLLLTTNSVSKDISVLSIPNLASGHITPIDFNKNKPGTQGINTNGEPTSVSIHPNRNIAFAAVNAQHGKLIAFDLNQAKTGKTKFILDQKVGTHLDSLAISNNGKWAVIADEAEGNSKTEGAIILVNISKIGTSTHLPTYKVKDLAKAIGRPPGRIEPEFVAIDPQSRFAAVACQDDNVIVILPLNANPKVASIIRLPRISQPDGVNLLNYSPNTTLLSIAEEGTDTVSIYKINPNQLKSPPTLITRMDIRSLSGTGSRSDPEGVYMFRQTDKIYLAIAIERANKTLIMDISNPSKPIKKALIKVGNRPEGIIVQKQAGKSYIITGDEGKPGKGEVSIIEIH